MFRRETVHSHFFCPFFSFSWFFCPTSCRLHAPSAIFLRVGSALWGSLLTALSCCALSCGKSLRVSLRHEGRSSAPARVGVRCLEGRMSVVFLFPLESRKRPCHPGENVEQNAAGDPGRKRERTRRERLVIQPSRRLFAPQAKINAEMPRFVVTIH